MSPSFLPTLPLQLSYPLMFGVLLVAGMMGGELARALRLPRILGYTVVGLVIGELGRRMDLRWMKRDWTLAAMGVAESFISFGAVFVTLLVFDFEPVHAGIA